MARTIKDIDAEIKALQKEREDIRIQGLAKKYASVLEIFEERGLSVTKISKMITSDNLDENNSTTTTVDTTDTNTKENKTAEEVKVKKPRRKSTFKEKICTSCGKIYIPRFGAQKICDACKAKKDKETQEIEN